ncbi:MAG: hypothetical protein K2P93_04950 [Alphaproteobacteria bacterium]|nr:hypothetical protein [Alphaproteobacteria bacterium]
MQELKIVNYNKSCILLCRGVCFLIFLLLPPLAQGSIFGFDSPPCFEGSHYDEKNHLCFYCPEGTKEENENFSVNKKCKGNPFIGMKCLQGQSEIFDEKKKLCIYCENGYVFGSNSEKCYPG